MTELDFGPLVLGGNVFGWTADPAESFAVLDAFVANGGRSIDTADAYSAWLPGHTGGESETILGDWFQSSGKRDDVVLATKVGSLATRKGLAAANIAAAVDDSLRRLRTDRIDLYFAHRDDESVPQEETMSAFDALVRDGKVRELGASNFAPDRLRTAAAIASTSGLTPFTVAQDKWSLVERGVEQQLVPTTQELGIVQVPYSSLASGFLTGKYRADSTVDSARSKAAGAYLQNPRNLELLAVLDDVAAAQHVSMTAIALAWLREQPTVAAPIASARTADQAASLVESFQVRLTPQQLEQLSATTAAVAA